MSKTYKPERKETQNFSKAKNKHKFKRDKIKEKELSKEITDIMFIDDRYLEKDYDLTTTLAHTLKYNVLTKKWELI